MRFKLFLLLIIFVIIPTNQLKGQTPTYLVWDYPISQIPNITEFQISYNSGSYISVGIPTSESLPDTFVNHKSFRSLIPSTLTTGQEHTARIRVCNGPSDCSWDSIVTFKFIGPVTNLRIKK